MSVIKHGAVGGLGLNPTTNEETLQQNESEDTLKLEDRGGHRSAHGLKTEEHISISHNEKQLLCFNNCIWWLAPTSSLLSADLIMSYQSINDLH